MWRALRPHRRGAGFGREGSHHCQQQHGYRWPRSGNPVGKQAGQQGDLVLCGENKLFAELYLAGELEVEFTPQGTLAERLRAGGAGIPAFYTATGVGTMIAEGKPEAVFDGKRYIQERGIVADLGLVHAHTGDIDGNLVYRLTAQNFNPCALPAARSPSPKSKTSSDAARSNLTASKLPECTSITSSRPATEKPIEKRTTR